MSPTFLVRRKTAQFACFRYDGPGDDFEAFLNGFGGPGLTKPGSADGEQAWDSDGWPFSIWDQYIGQWVTVLVGYYVVIFGEPLKAPLGVRLQALSPERFALEYEAV